MRHNTLNLNDITAQIKQYVRQIKDNKKSDFATSTLSEINSQPAILHSNDLRSNINKLDGSNKLSLHRMSSDDCMAITTAGYASEAYEHLSSIEDKHKIVIDFMHKNNKNFDLKA